ncbi:(d)CMP kinase [Deltaproteobacteria bacterium TL4]
MKITLAGVPGSGKSTIRQQLATHYKLEFKATGDFMRKVALKYGYQDITKFLVEYISTHPEIDYEVDAEQKLYGQTHDNFVLDAHIGFHFVPDSIKVFLECSPEVSAQRIFAARRTTEDSKSVEDTLKANKKRSQTMSRNFKKLYNVDIYNKNNYDVLVDTTYFTPDQVVEELIQKIDSIKASP